MALGNNTQFKVAANFYSADTSGNSSLTGKTMKEIVQNFVDGAGAGAADDIVEATVAGNNVAVALSTFQTNRGVAISAQTKIKAILIVNEGALSTTVSSNITGLPVGVLGASSGTNISFLAANNPTAAGWACTAANTFTSNGALIRIFMLMA